MELRYRKAVVRDAALLIDIYNAAFYGDYIKYGVCPGYGKTKEMMERSILQYPKYIITCGEVPVGCISCKETSRTSIPSGVFVSSLHFRGRG